MSTRGQCHTLLQRFYQSRDTVSYRIFLFANCLDIFKVMTLDLFNISLEWSTNKKSPWGSKRQQDGRKKGIKSRSEALAVLWQHGQDSDAASTRMCFWSKEAERENLDPKRKKQLLETGAEWVENLAAGKGRPHQHVFKLKTFNGNMFISSLNSATNVNLGH